MHESVYANKTLYQLMLEARRAYHRYGNVPLLDSYDKKSSVYLVRVTDNQNQTEEWLCARFVPSDGIPFGIDDFKLYFYKGKPLESAVRGLIFDGLFSISRLCGIPKSGLHYTAISFALMNKQVLADCRKFGFGRNHVVAQIPDALIDGFLTLRVGKTKFKPNFVPAYQLLGVKNADIGLARTAYIYRYPLYFLRTQSVIALLKTLVKKAILSDSAIKHYSGGKLTADAILRRDDFKIEEFSWLGKALTKNKKLRRRFIKVPDGPKLRIIEAGVWERSLDKLIRAARDFSRK